MTYTIIAKATDSAGNENSAQDSFMYDETPPTVSFDPNSQPWTKSDVTVTISANDGTGSGVANIYYVIKGKDDTCPSVGDSSYTKYTDSVTISNEGEWKICAYAEDNAGNTPQSASESGTYQIDKTVPQVSIDDIPDYVNSLTQISGTASDSGSGVSKVEVLIIDNTDNKYWDGSTWADTEPSDWLDATGTTSVSYTHLTLPTTERV